MNPPPAVVGACVACHEGAGAGEHLPALLGKSPEELAAALDRHRFRGVVMPRLLPALSDAELERALEALSRRWGR